MFENGNKRVLRLVIWELACACALIAIMQIQGMLPSQDWIPPRLLKPICFGLAMFGTLLKAVEMFFNKTVALFKKHVPGDDAAEDPAVTTTTTTETVVKP